MGKQEVKVEILIFDDERSKAGRNRVLEAALAGCEAIGITAIAIAITIITRTNLISSSLVRGCFPSLCNARVCGFAKLRLISA